MYESSCAIYILRLLGHFKGKQPLHCNTGHFTGKCHFTVTSISQENKCDFFKNYKQANILQRVCYVYQKLSHDSRLANQRYCHCGNTAVG